MYFSGHLLDGYGKHIAASSVLPLAELCGEDAAVSDRMHVRIAGIVTSVTKKMTKKDEQMAFFTVEDRYNEIECLVFPRQYGQISTLLTPDTGVLIDGNVSLKDEEAPKIIVSSVKPLIEDSGFVAESAQTPAPVRTEVPRAEGAERTPPHATVPVRGGDAKKRISRLYLRFESKDSEAYRKVANLLEIFDDGSFPIVIYDKSTNTYTPYPHGVYMSDYVRREIEAILGAENVVPR